MKFHQLRLGARFRFRDQLLRKVSPLKAAADVGDHQVLVHRSAEVAALDEHGQPAALAVPENLPSHRLGAELDRLVEAFSLAAERADPPLTHAQRDHLILALRTANQDLITRLALSD